MAFTPVTIAPWPIQSELVTPARVAAPAWQLWLTRLRLAVNGVNALVLSGKGSPLNVVTAPVGTMYLRNDGSANTTLYIKEANSDATGWVAK
jgi:hypothetical protein